MQSPVYGSSSSNNNNNTTSVSLEQWIGRLGSSRSPSQYRRGVVPYVEKNGNKNFRCLLRNTGFMHTTSAKHHFFSKRHIKIYNQVKVLEEKRAAEKRFLIDLAQRHNVANTIMKYVQQIKYAPDWKSTIEKAAFSYMIQNGVSSFYYKSLLLRTFRIYERKEASSLLELAILKSSLLGTGNNNDDDNSNTSSTTKTNSNNTSTTIQQSMMDDRDTTKTIDHHPYPNKNTKQDFDTTEKEDDGRQQQQEDQVQVVSTSNTNTNNNNLTPLPMYVKKLKDDKTLNTSTYNSRILQMYKSGCQVIIPNVFAFLDNKSTICGIEVELSIL